MCGSDCWRCGQPTYGLIPHTEENCINSLKGALRSACEGRELVRKTLTDDLARMREAFWAWESVQFAANSSGDGEDYMDANELWNRLKEEMK